MTDTSGGFSFPDAAERRAFRDRMSRGIERYIPPEMRPFLGLVAESTPSAALERAGAASMEMAAPDRTAMERLGSLGAMLSETAGVAAPVLAGRAVPSAEAAQEMFMGLSAPMRSATETFIERMNQPGEMPERLMSGIDPLAAFRAARDAMLGARSDMPFEDLVDLSGRQAAARDAVVSTLSEAPSVRLFNRDGRAVVVGEGMGPGEDGKFRVTFFDADRRPTNHTVYETKEDALREALNAGYDSRTAAPASASMTQSPEEIIRALREGVPAAEARLADDMRIGNERIRAEALARSAGRGSQETASPPEGGIRVFHASPDQIEGDFRVSDRDVGLHFANNPDLAQNAAVKSALERPETVGNIRPQEFVINATSEQVADIPASSNRFDFYNILESLQEQGRIDQDLFDEIFDGLEKIENTASNVSEMMQEQNRFFSDRLSRDADIKALRYYNEFDAGPTWADLEQGRASSSVAPDYSYIVLDPSAVTRPSREFARGGEVMMRGNMSSQLSGGIGGFAGDAKNMFRGPRGLEGFAQYMQAGGEVGRGQGQGSTVGRPVSGPAAGTNLGADDEFLTSVRNRVIAQSGVDPIKVAMEEGVDPDLFLRLVAQESGGRADAESDAGAYGFTQLMDATARELGVDRTDPEQNLRGGARYLRQQLDSFQEVPLALAAYNAGPNAVRRFGGIPPYSETRNYIARILGVPGGEMGVSPPMRPDPIVPTPRPAVQGPNLGGDPLMALGQVVAQAPFSLTQAPAMPEQDMPMPENQPQQTTFTRGQGQPGERM